MEEEVKYTSEFDGQTTDEILKHAKSVKDLTIPSLSNISGFVCIDNEGKAIGMMSKEDIAQVVGGLIGTVTPEKNGLKPAFEAIVVFRKDNNTKACILVNTNYAGEIFTALLGISGVSGYTATIIITVNKWNSTMLFAKTLVGTIPDGAKLSYKIDTNGKVNIYIDSKAYFLITLKPISTINASINTVSAIPDGTISINL